MQAASRPAVAALAAVLALGSWVVLSAVQTPAVQPPTQGPLPLEPLGVRGEALFPAFEGWGPAKDGKQVLLLGYYNRNQDPLDVPIGPNNMIEPGGPDLGQPSHFLPRRQYGVFAIEVPANFGNKRYTWTLVANGQKSQVSFWTNPPYWIDFFKNTANGNETPIIKFSETGPELQGPNVGYALTLTGSVGQPVTLNVWAKDKPSDEPEGRGGPPPAPPTTTADGRGGRGRGDTPAGRGDVPGGRGAAGGRGAGGGGGGGGGGRGGEPRGDVTVLWQRYRGPAEIKFSEERSLLFNKRDANLVMKATTQATFGQPGEYVVLVTANDQSGPGGGGDQCCWTSARVRVNVK